MLQPSAFVPPQLLSYLIVPMAVWISLFTVLLLVATIAIIVGLLAWIHQHVLRCPLTRHTHANASDLEQGCGTTATAQEGWEVVNLGPPNNEKAKDRETIEQERKREEQMRKRVDAIMVGKRDPYAESVVEWDIEDLEEREREKEKYWTGEVSASHEQEKQTGKSSQGRY